MGADNLKSGFPCEYEIHLGNSAQRERLQSHSLTVAQEPFVSLASSAFNITSSVAF